jgi:hypothetical protein
MLKNKVYALDVPCEECGAKVGRPCKRSMGAHAARNAERDRQREQER